ncbi:hypothetical protein PGT21_004331 [Puccinia graminis f. sp. tritici]|uniref:Uncharacterized protein n=1 Tax=Puccinia graminis f. sp. tritici TaxID=56615 RepID=A0A5B0Q2L8_PUCGR|nr:hypothetical protein PGT21_004331 [Puccinia graminis f. sp. tritici]
MEVLRLALVQHSQPHIANHSPPSTPHFRRDAQPSVFSIRSVFMKNLGSIQGSNVGQQQNETSPV